MPMLSMKTTKPMLDMPEMIDDAGLSSPKPNRQAGQASRSSAARAGNKVATAYSERPRPTPGRQRRGHLSHNRSEGS